MTTDTTEQATVQPAEEASLLDSRLEAFVKRWEWLVSRRKAVNFWQDFVKGDYGERLQKEAESIVSGMTIDEVRALEKTVEAESARLKEVIKAEAAAKMAAMKAAQAEADAKAAEEKAKADEARKAEKAAKRGKKRS